MNILSLDTETTIYNKGNCYDSRNKLVAVSWSYGGGGQAVQWDLESAIHTQGMVDDAAFIVGFNFKFDLHWLRKSGINFDGKRIWDVQLAEFILSHQTQKFPSLNDTCLKYGIPVKLDVVKTEYWDKGIQTDEIPWEVLRDYAAHDAAVTLACYHAQRALMTPRQVKLHQLMCLDMQILQEMEATGLPFDEELCAKRSKEIDEQIAEINAYLSGIYPSVPINFNSGDQLSAFLYGGVVREEIKEHAGFFKTGDRKGQPKFKNVEIEHVLPRLYEPLKGSELAKDGYFATDEGTLKKLKGNKEIVSKLLTLAKLEKLNGTYYKGLVTLREKMHWPKGLLHGNFNQVTAATGRLSSSKPNLQNFASELQDIFITEYE